MNTPRRLHSIRQISREHRRVEGTLRYRYHPYTVRRLLVKTTFPIENPINTKSKYLYYNEYNCGSSSICRVGLSTCNKNTNIYHTNRLADKRTKVLAEETRLATYTIHSYGIHTIGVCTCTINNMYHQGRAWGEGCERCVCVFEIKPFI